MKYEGVAEGVNLENERSELEDSWFTFSKLDELKSEMQESAREVCGNLQVSYNEMS
jgi:hypothetical protein